MTKKITRDFDPTLYWEQRLHDNPTIRGTGHRRFSEAYNYAMYEVAAKRIRSVLDRVGFDLHGKSVLDIGAGLGYFIQRFIEWGVSDITGWDITQTSIDYLINNFQSGNFKKVDISSLDISTSTKYDLVSAISVMYHIVDESRFHVALGNMCRLVKEGGHMLIIDSFHRAGTPDSRHVKMRNLKYYTPVLEATGHKVLVIKPLYYIMSRSGVPVIGPLLLGMPLGIKCVLIIEDILSKKLKSNWGWISIMVTRRENI